MNKTIYKVLIIGCGNIAGGYDLLRPEDALPIAQAKAFAKHGGFLLSACIDPDNTKRQSFQSRWKVPFGFSNLNEFEKHYQQYDLISICSPSISHSHDIEAALELKPKLIFCEKPMTLNLKETIKAVKACADQGVLLAVNFSRRWAPKVIQLKKQLTQQDWGCIRSVSVFYNKGILNNGSHMIDLLFNLFGPLVVKYVGYPVSDFFKDDPTVDAVLVNLEGLPIHINVAHAQDYALFEMHIITEKGVISMEDGGDGWRFRSAQTSTHLPGYRFLDPNITKETVNSYAMTAAVTNLHDALSYGAAIACTGYEAIQTQALCEDIKKIASTHRSKQGFIKEVAKPYEY
jgi:predicted dehydrogenase